MFGIRPKSPRAPGRYDALLKFKGKPYGLMLKADPWDLQIGKIDNAQSVVPTDFSPHVRNPFIEGTRTWKHWVFGAGEHVRFEDNTQTYTIADGVDASCGGIAILGPASSTVTPSGSGSPAATPIHLIHEWPGTSLTTPTPRLYALNSTQILVNGGDPGAGADWSVSKDMSTGVVVPTAGLTVTPSGLTAPAISSVTSTGTNDSAAWGYRVQAYDASGNTISPVSVQVLSTQGANNIVTATDYNTITWGLVSGAVTYKIFLTTVPGGGTINGIAGATGLVGAVADPGNSFNHDGPNGGAAAPAAKSGTTTWKYKVVAQGGSDPPHSAASTEISTAASPNAGGAVLTAGIFNRVSWTDTGAIKYQVWRTSAGGTPATIGLIGTVVSGVGLLDDTGLAPTASTLGTAPPSTALYQTPTDLHSFLYVETSLVEHHYLLAGMDAGNYWYTTDGTTWLEGPFSGRVFGHNGLTVYRATTIDINNPAASAAAYIRSSVLGPVNVTAANWTLSGSQEQGEVITKLLNVNGVIVVFTLNGIFLLGGAPITPTPTIASYDNGRTAAVFGRAAYATFGGEWYKITVTSSTSATIEAVGLGKLVQNTSSIKGVVVASAGHSTWFNYFCVYNAADNCTYLFKLGSWLNPEDLGTDHRWRFDDYLHGAIAKWTGRRAYSMSVSSISGSGTEGNPRLFIGMDNGTFRMIVLPKLTPFPPADSSCTFLTGGTIELPDDDAGYGSNLKIYRRISVMGSNLDNDQYVTVGYDVDSIGTYTDIDTPVTDPGSSLNFPSGLVGKTIQPRLTLVTNTTASTPQITEVQMHATVRGPTDEFGNVGFLRQRKITVDCQDLLIDRYGTPIRSWSGQQIRDVLQQATASGDVEFTFRDGITRTMTVISYSEGEAIWPDGQRHQEVTLELVEGSIITGLQEQPAKMDPGWGLDPGWEP